MEKIIIAAASKNYVIGSKDKIPWNSKKELEHFKKSTVGFPVLMGRKTWDTLQKPLEKRINIVITRNKNLSFSRSNVVIFHTISDAVVYCEKNEFSKMFIIGGAEIFQQTILISDRILLSQMKFEVNGDKFFPRIEEKSWKLESESDLGEFILFNYIKR